MKKNKMKSCGQLYGQHCRIYSLIGEVQLREAKKADSDTGGNEMLIHNWGNEQSKKVVEFYHNRTDRARKIFENLYNVSFFHTYPSHIRSIAYFKSISKPQTQTT